MITFEKLAPPRCMAAGSGSPSAPGGAGRGSTASTVRIAAALRKLNRPAMIRKVLIIEDDEAKVVLYGGLLKALRAAVSPPVEVVIVSQDFSLEVGKLFPASAASDIDLIIMDHTIVGSTTTGVVLTMLIRERGHTCYIAANSSIPIDSQALLSAGADFAVDKAHPFRGLLEIASARVDPAAQP